jgi:hypothetical protein
MTTQIDTSLELGDIQAAALMPRPHPYVGAYWAFAYRPTGTRSGSCCGG